MRGKGHGYKGNKTPVAGVVDRNGDIRLQVVSHTDRATLHGFIRKHTAPDTEAIYTDEWPTYEGIADTDTRHETVDHRTEQWINCSIHANSAESV